MPLLLLLLLAIIDRFLWPSIGGTSRAPDDDNKAEPGPAAGPLQMESKLVMKWN